MSQNISEHKRLGQETSPYLLQHAHNPVDWYPWGDQAFEQARRDNKPVLLSIGYAACHWCHVMAHESFEDPDTAALMNELFVNIKVDREERPDIDRIYQHAHQILARRRGGWPLTLFLTHDRIPFFAGTYFPRQPRHGLPGFSDLMRRIVDLHRRHHSEIDQQNTALMAALNHPALDPASTDEIHDAGPLQVARDQLQASYDPEHGGFGGAPKFPHPTYLSHLLQSWWRSRQTARTDEAALNMACFSLRRMNEGGLYDHLGGGFYRYSTDERWMIPHFEKMLYDNGPLLGLYAQLFAITSDAQFRRAVLGTADWVLREMQAPEGGYFSSLDADSEGEEGQYYVWTPEQVAAHLDADEYAVASARFGLNQAPNFEGRWHLFGHLDPTILADRLKLDPAILAQRLSSAEKALLQARSERIRPHRDEKILGAWNALMIKGMARASLHLDRSDLADSAFRALDFVKQTLWRDGRLLAVYAGGESKLNAYLDDYAFLADAALTLSQCRWRAQDLEFAVALTEALLTHFEDAERGGFYYTSHDHETLISRPKPLLDDALPCGNGVAGRVLLRLGHLLGETRYLDAADRLMRWCWPTVKAAPLAHASLVAFLDASLTPQQTVVIRGDPESIEAWRRVATQDYVPNRLTLAIPTGANPLPGLMDTHRPRSGTAAYLCRGQVCSPPIQHLEAFEEALSCGLQSG